MKMRTLKHRQARLSFESPYGERAKFRRQVAAFEEIARALSPLTGVFNRLQVAMFRAFSDIGRRREGWDG